ncbi:MAG TPA: TonB-dependent receptor, partial [Gammaproteobacteria bacterium]
MRLTRFTSVCGALFCATAISTASAQLPMEVVEAVTTATDGSDGIDSLVGLIQTGSAEDVREQRALDLSEFISRNFSSVVVNDAQSNPLQPDVRYRGFVASPLLGLPQGIAVYQDGVRVNEPFGDTVNWALLPTLAVDTVHFVPGSSPLFGLNSLGGALSIRTKSGLTHSGTRLSVQVGSNSRSEVLAETGGAVSDRTAYYLAGTYLEDDGWRDFSPSRLSSVYAKLTHTLDDASVDVSLTSVDTNLIGNGAAPAELLAMDPTAIFTRPDQTRNDLDQLVVEMSRDLENGVAVTGSAYLRRSDVATLNGDDSDFEACEDNPALVCLEDDGAAPVRDTNGRPISALPELLGATVNNTNTEQDGRGFSVQIAHSTAGASRRGRWLAGVSFDDADIDFSGFTELGTLDPTRRAVAGGSAVTDSLTSLYTRSRNTGVYLAYTGSPAEAVSLSVSGRYNRTDVTLRDRLGTALNGDHNFSKFNPSLGVAWQAAEDLTLFASI